MKLLVCGSRKGCPENKWLRSEIRKYMKPGTINLIVTGGATGVDSQAKLFALETGIPYCEFPALWGKLGAEAGPFRNQYMLEFIKPDMVLAFPGGKGTEDCVKKAVRLKIPVEYALQPQDG